MFGNDRDGRVENHIVPSSTSATRRLKSTPVETRDPCAMGIKLVSCESPRRSAAASSLTLSDIIGPSQQSDFPFSCANGCVTAVKTLFSPISHQSNQPVYGSTDLRIYPPSLHPPLLGHPGHAHQQIKLPPSMRCLVRTDGPVLEQARHAALQERP